MVNRLLIALLALCTANAAIAQSFPKPPDVATFSQVAPVLKTDGSANTVIDSTITPMPIGTGLTNIPVPSTTGRLATMSDQSETTVTASTSGSVATVTAVASGVLRVGDYFYGPGIAAGTTITSFGTGTGGVGTYNLSTSQTVSSETMFATVPTYCLSEAYGGPPQCDENKFRTISGVTNIAPDDPQRNYGEPGTSHVHQFFGGANCNAFSTYKSNRLHSLTSTLAGTDINATCYWFPAVEVLNPYGDGKNFAVKPDWVTVYYTENPATDGTGNGAKAFIPVGLRYVFGFDMDATWDAVNNKANEFAWLQSYVDAANTASGHTRYSLTNGSGTYPHHAVYDCPGATPEIVTVLTNADGSDPYSGTCEPAVFTGSTSGSTLTVSAMTSGTIKNGEILSVAGASPGAFYINSQLTGTTGGVGTYALSNALPVNLSSQTMRAVQDFNINISAPDCYDGTNLWSPGGYKNVIPQIHDNDIGALICPSNYYKIVHLTLEIHFTQYGWSDRQRWDLTSDIAYRAKYGLTKTQLPPGTTFHTDWMDGWDHLNGMIPWQTKCSGVEHGTGHQCNSSQIDNTHRLIGGEGNEAGAGGLNPQVDTSSKPHLLETDSQWELIPPSWTGGMTNMKVHH